MLRSLKKRARCHRKNSAVLVDQYVEATDPADLERLNLSITQGFYGRR